MSCRFPWTWLRLALPRDPMSPVLTPRRRKWVVPFFLRSVRASWGAGAWPQHTEVSFLAGLLEWRCSSWEFSARGSPLFEHCV